MCPSSRQPKLPTLHPSVQVLTTSSAPHRYGPLVEAAKLRIGAQQERDELGTLAVFYKTAAELYMLAQDYTGGEHLCNEALRCFNKVHDFDCSGLIEGCEMLLNIAKSNKPKQAASPAKTAPSAGAGPSSA